MRYQSMMDNDHGDSDTLRTGLSDGLAAGLKPLPPGITPSAEKGIAPLTTRDYRVENPMDQAAVDRLLYDIICQERATLATGARLYIVIGEDHAMPSHMMTQTGLIDNITADRDTHGHVMLALEVAYNSLPRHIRLGFDIQIPEPLKKSFHEMDPLGHYYSRAVLAKNAYALAPQSLNRLLSRALSHNLPIALCDAACNEHHNLDPVDDLAQEIAQSERFRCNLMYKEIPHTPLTGDMRGIKIRNAVMARRAVANAQDNKAHTIVFPTGMNHLGGIISEGLDYGSSLTAMLKEEIRPRDRVLSVFFSSAVDDYMPERDVPPKMWEDNPNHIIIRDLCDAWYVYYQTGEEDECIRRLGDSYLAQEFGGEVPQRFQPPELPSKDTICTEARQLIQDHTP